MYLKSLKITNFRNYHEGLVDFPPGITIIVGGNGAGKTSLLEAARYVLCGSSFRTSRDSEMVLMGSGFFRVGAEVESGALFVRSVSLEEGGGARVDPGGGPKWLEPGAVLCFSPDDLQLVKGPPSGRRRFLDEAVSKRSAAYRRDSIDYQKTLAQRNSFLQRARMGLVQLSDITPWDRQLSSLALKIYLARRRHCESLSPEFESSFNEITAEGDAARVRHVSQLKEISLAANPEAALVDRLRETWSSDMERLTTGIGTHRDDVEFVLRGRSLKPYGSQGEQRTAVLALLLAERNLARCEGEARPLLLLDDVMSELDPSRRRRLMATLAGCGQAIITAADRNLFSEEELERSMVTHVIAGNVTAAEAGTRGQG